MKTGKLFLIPNVLAENSTAFSFPALNGELIKHIKQFAVEDPKSARRLLRQLNPERDLNDLELYSVHKKKGMTDYSQLIAFLKSGEDMGLISDAGCPAVADPGESFVYKAHSAGIEVMPLVGPSSILMALMSSGLNGQSFTFLGYLPKEQKDRISEIKRTESLSQKQGTTFICIETPFRNMHLFEDLIKNLGPMTKLSISANLCAPSQYIRTMNIAEWRKLKPLPQLTEKPCVFLWGS